MTSLVSKIMLIGVGAAAGLAVGATLPAHAQSMSNADMMTKAFVTRHCYTMMRSAAQSSLPMSIYCDH